MSLICLGYTNSFGNNTKKEYIDSLIQITNEYCLGIFFAIGWNEPIASYYSEHGGLLFSITDSVSCDNCEMFLLPDQWVYNGKTNCISFIQRMSCIQKIANYTTANDQQLELYIGESGTEYDDYTNIVLDSPCNLKTLAEKISSVFFEDAIHLTITHFIDN